MKNLDITKKEPPWIDVTTVMMRNLPNKYTQQMLIEELQDAGFRLQYDFDFFYLPMDHSNAANLGYAFINFVATAMANAFAAAFQGKKMRRFNSNKTVVVMPASMQGYEKNYAYYASTRVVQAEDPQYRPLFLRTPTPGQMPVLPSPPAARSGKEGRGKKGREKGKGGDLAMMDMSYMAAPYAFVSAEWAPGAWPSAPSVTTAPDTWQQTPRYCSNCGSECSPGHRFCAFCGALIGPKSSHPRGAPRNVSSALRADAPSFTPGGGVADAGELPCGLDGEVEAGAAESLAYCDSVSDELDVMRGRMMLLAALKDMEKREVSARVDDDLRNGAAT